MTGRSRFFLLQGTKTIGADTVDKVWLSFDAPKPRELMVFLVRETQPVTLVSGDTAGGADAEGYPTALNGEVLTRQ